MKIRKLALRLYLLACAIGLLAVVTGTVKLFRIPTSGMSPTVQAGDYVTAIRLFNPSEKTSRGEVVVFDPSRVHPDLGGKYIQRAVALGGDTISLANGRLSVNGTLLPERDGQIPRAAGHDDARFPSASYPLVVPEGAIFTMGDNYNNSLDSRYFGPFPADAVTHRPGRVIFPLSRAGKIE